MSPLDAATVEELKAELVRRQNEDVSEILMVYKSANGRIRIGYEVDGYNDPSESLARCKLYYEAGRLRALELPIPTEKKPVDRTNLSYLTDDDD